MREVYRGVRASGTSLHSPVLASAPTSPRRSPATTPGPLEMVGIPTSVAALVPSNPGGIYFKALRQAIRGYDMPNPYSEIRV